jgi:hypothetical protein
MRDYGGDPFPSEPFDGLITFDVFFKHGRDLSAVRGIHG